MDLSKLYSILQNEPEYRKKQIKRALFVDLVEKWEDVTTLPLTLRLQLSKECLLSINAQSFHAKDNESQKTLIRLSDGFMIESVLMHHKNGRNTVCVSSQIGCPLGCIFCNTGMQGFKRNLTAFEIIEQVLYFARLLIKKNEKVNNVVFMGMGEPLLNYDNVITAIKILNDPEGFGLGARHISVSTSGIVPGIEKFTHENLEVNLALSLHAPNDILRSKLMPINKKYPLQEVLNAIGKYIKKTNRRVMFEYILIQNVNDSPKFALELTQLVKPFLGFVNLIPYNDTGKFKASPSQKIQAFKKILEQNGVTVTQRHKFGDGVHGACGQLVYQKEVPFGKPPLV